MRIECPTCSAVYDLPERLLSGGSRTLRCAACGNTWTVNPEAAHPEAAHPEPANPEPTTPASVAPEAVSPDPPAEPAVTEAAPPAAPPSPPEAPPPSPPARGPLSNDRNFAALVEAVVGPSRDEVPGPREPVTGTTMVIQEEAADPAEEAEPPYEAEAPPETPLAAIVARASGAPAPSRPSLGLIMAWVATLGGLGALILALALFPQGVVAHWPAAARLYEAVGITVGAS